MVIWEGKFPFVAEEIARASNERGACVCWLGALCSLNRCLPGSVQWGAPGTKYPMLISLTITVHAIVKK